MIKTYFKELLLEWKKLISFFKKGYQLLAFRYIKRKAYQLHKKYDCQVFVVKYKGKITIISKYQFKKMRQKKMFPLSFTATELKSMSLYYTPKRYDKKRIQRTTRKV